MNIRSLLSLRFILIVVFILVMSFTLIYLFSADYREETFYDRLHSKANNTAKLLIEVDEVDVDLLTRIEKDNPVSLVNEKILVYDYRNALLFSTDDSAELAVDEELLDRIRLEDNVRFRQGEFEVLGFLFKGPYDRFAVVAAATDIYGLNKLRNLRNILIIVFVISIAVVSASGWLFAGKALQPISRLVSKVDEISISSLNLRLDEGNGKDEIAHLAKTFNSMLRRLEDSFHLQKNFIANASHELRTPLTSITGQLEVALLTVRTPDDYQEVLRSLLEDIISLNVLSNRLLLLAQTSSETPIKLNVVRVDDAVWQAREEIHRINPSYRVAVDIDARFDDEKLLVIRGDEHLLKIAIVNLIENACKYSGDHTAEVMIRSIGQRLNILINDQGIGIPAAERENVFQPFYRASNTKGIKGHGIGLSMASGILRLHNSDLHIHSNPSGGTSVSIVFN